MEDLKFYKKYPGLIPFLILSMFILIIAVFLLEIWPILNPIMNLLQGDWILSYAIFGSFFITIYAFIMLLVRLIRKKRPILFYQLTIIEFLVLFWFMIYCSGG